MTLPKIFFEAFICSTAAHEFVVKISQVLWTPTVMGKNSKFDNIVRVKTVTRSMPSTQRSLRHSSMVVVVLEEKRRKSCTGMHRL